MDFSQPLPVHVDPLEIAVLILRQDHQTFEKLGKAGVSGGAGGCYTTLAEAIEDDLVGFRQESGGSEILEAAGAIFHVEHTVAPSAVEVMVVLLVGNFVATHGAGELDGPQPPFVDQGADSPIDGGDPQLWSC